MVADGPAVAASLSVVAPSPTMKGLAPGVPLSTTTRRTAKHEECPGAGKPQTGFPMAYPTEPMAGVAAEVVVAPAASGATSSPPMSAPTARADFSISRLPPSATRSVWQPTITRQLKVC